RRQVAIEEVRLGETEVDLLLALRDHRTDAQILATAEQIALTDRDIAEHALAGREAGADREFTRRLLLDIDADHRLVGRAAGIGGDVDLLEVAQILDALLRALQLRGIERVALDQTELAADHLVERPHISGDVDTLDIDARPFLDLESHVDRATVDVALDPRLDIDKGIAPVAERFSERRDGLVDLVGVVPVAFRDGHQRFQILGLHVRQLIGDADLAESVALAFLDREGDEEAVARRRQLGHRRHDAEIGVSFRQVEFAQQLAIVGEAVGIVVVLAREEAIPARLLGLQDLAQATGAELVVADKGDAAHAGHRPLVDLEHQVDAVLLERDDLGIDGSGEAAVAAVEVEDALDVALHLGARIDDTRLELHLGVERLIAELVVTLERDAVDDRILDHPHDECVTVAAQRDVREKPGGEQALQRAVDAVRVKRVARLDQHVGTYRLRLNALRALDANLGDGATGRYLRECRTHRKRRHPHYTRHCDADCDNSQIPSQNSPRLESAPLDWGVR